MDNKYNVPKKKKPETKSEVLAEKIEELVKRRDRETNAAAKQAISAEIMTLYAQFERLKL